jgi:hypothetical protein
MATYLSLYEILQGLSLGRGASIDRGGKPATQNLKPEPFPTNREGVFKMKPEQLLSVRVPVARIRNGEIEGYQRVLVPMKARSMYRWLKANEKTYYKVLPAVEVSICEDHCAYYTDGQHRAAGGIMAKLPIKVIVTRRTFEEARQLFALQGRALRPSRNLLIIDSDGPFEEYIQDALTSNDHPWSRLISASQSGGSKNRISVTTAYTLLRIYVAGKNSPAGRDVGKNTDPTEFDQSAADQFATLLAAFGTRQTNPLAFGSISLRAIAIAARAIFRNAAHEVVPDDQGRWIRLMPQFQFSTYLHLKNSTELANHLIRFWNKRLSDSRKIALITV